MACDNTRIVMQYMATIDQLKTEQAANHVAICHVMKVINALHHVKVPDWQTKYMDAARELEYHLGVNDRLTDDIRSYRTAKRFFQGRDEASDSDMEVVRQKKAKKSKK